MAAALTGESLRPDLIDAVRLLHEVGELDWVSEVSGSARTAASSRTAVVLEDSAVEHFASFAGMSGADLDSYLLEGYAHALWAGRVHGVVERCLMSAAVTPGGMPSWELRSKLSIPGPRSALSLVRAGERAEELIAMCEDRILRHYARRWLETLVSPQKYLDSHATLSATGTKLARRAERVRNSLVHGNPADKGVVRSIRDISRYRAYVSLDVAMECISRGVPMADELERRRDVLAALMDAQRSGTSLVEHWRTAA